MTTANYFKRVVTVKFGSHLYGTDTPASDLDIKSVYIPDARAILLGRVKGSITNKRPKAMGEKNLAGELDEESYSLQRFLGLAAEGQTVALDVLFAPPSAMIGELTWVWRTIQDNRHRLVTRRSAAFVGYCRQQANKYGIKGSRVSASRRALEMLTAWMDVYPSDTRLAAVWSSIVGVARATDHMDIVEIEQASGMKIEHWDVCGRKMAQTSSIKFARDCMAHMVDQYGSRALQAETQQGVDWKALSHAVRVGRQAVELFTTGRVTFPLPYAPHILAIKLGELSYQEVAGEIEQLLEQVEVAAINSALPEKPDLEWIDEFVTRVYADVVWDT